MSRSTFEFDPRLAVDSLLASPDAAREDAMHRAVRLEETGPDAGGSPRFFPLGGELMIRNPPRLVVSSTLPHDLAHRVWIEIEGVEGRIPGGTLIVHGRSIRDDQTTAEPPTHHELTATPGTLPPDAALDRTGRRSIRVILTADPNLGWTDPEVRSVWPGEITTDWVAADVVRR